MQLLCGIRTCSWTLEIGFDDIGILQTQLQPRLSKSGSYVGSWRDGRIVDYKIKIFFFLNIGSEFIC